MMQSIQSFYQDTFIAWTHLKAIRVFIESVLRYGLPVEKSSAAVLAPMKNKDKQLRSALEEMFKSNVPLTFASSAKEAQSDAASAVPDEEFYPYVWVNFPLE